MRSIVMLSGGLDSTVAMAAMAQRTQIVLALTFDYGQRAVEKEIQAAQAIADYYGVQHQVIRIDFLREITSTSLVNRAVDVPTLDVSILDNAEVTRETANKVWVPNRNGIFINIAAGFAEALECQQVAAGFNAEEGQTFPDNTPEYMAAATLALTYSTQHGVQVVSPTVDMTKEELVTYGKSMGAPLQFVWSCYHGNAVMCGTCESCQRLKRALERSGIQDTVSFAI